MAVAGWLIDKSALVRLGEANELNTWSERINEGQIYLSSITRLEIGYSARSHKDLVQSFSTLPLSRMKVEPLSPAIEDRAWEVLQLLAKKGQHRAPSLPDLLIAATAEKHDLILLHVDKDFDLIGKITGQEVERLKY
jgi:predicted nucleic acid-binding protein